MNESKKIATFNNRLLKRRVVVVFNYTWEEYRCILFLSGNLHNDSTYFTNSKDDALLTAKEMVK